MAYRVRVNASRRRLVNASGRGYDIFAGNFSGTTSDCGCNHDNSSSSSSSSSDSSNSSSGGSQSSNSSVSSDNSSSSSSSDSSHSSSGGGGGGGIGDYVFARYCIDSTVSSYVYPVLGTTDGDTWSMPEGCVYAQLTDDRTTTATPLVSLPLILGCSDLDCCTDVATVNASPSIQHASLTIPSPLAVTVTTVMYPCETSCAQDPTGPVYTFVPTPIPQQSDDVWFSLGTDPDHNGIGHSGVVFINYIGSTNGYYVITWKDSCNNIMWSGLKTTGDSPFGMYTLNCNSCCGANCTILTIDVTAPGP